MEVMDSYRIKIFVYVYGVIVGVNVVYVLYVIEL